MFGWLGRIWINIVDQDDGANSKNCPSQSTEHFPKKTTPPKTNMDTQKDALEMVIPFKYGHCWYLC